MNPATEFLSSVIKRCKDYKMLGDKTFAQLDGEQMLWQPNEASNSIAVIIQHLHGNMLSRWTNFLHEDGEKAWRQRDAEFEAQKYSKEKLLAMWEEGWKVFLDSLEALKEDDLLKTITIRSQPLIVLDAISRQFAHYSYHTGQIVYLGKWLTAGNWQSLTIPRNQSDAYNKSMNHHGK